MRRKSLSDPPEQLTQADRDGLVKWLHAEIKAGRLPRHFGKKPRPRVLLEECLDWHRMNGRQRHDWPATVRNWFRKAAQFEVERNIGRAELYRYEHPQESRDGPDLDAEPIGDLFRLIRGGRP